MQLAPAAFDQLPAPVQADSQQKGRAAVIDTSKKLLVQVAQAEDKSFHRIADSRLSETFRYAKRDRRTPKLRRTEPAQCGPILEPLLERGSAFLYRNSALSKCRFDGLAQRLAGAQRT